ncbi:DNA sulfur modification protein DndB [Neorhizobium sp. IRAMC:178]|uniref:DNA sulfur modification protein DndB n=1 Tax=Neorhizobium tunisiense TaxID=3144793 RepID=UPI0031F62BAC
MNDEPLILPSLRGSFGSWIFYSCLIPIAEVGARVKFAEDIHPDKALSRLIQRSLEGPRARQIAQYLSGNDDRFFNSLVLATYGGKPEWLEVGNFRSEKNASIVEKISQQALDTLGFLSLNGKEKLFAVDGQHRLAGIKQALEDNLELGQDLLPVILVGHKKTAAGLQRTRRLFTTLNKTAVPVKKSDIIALDEDDVMAIVSRQLVENEPSFRDPKIAVIASPNIPSGNRVCLATISTLYEVLRLLFVHVTQSKTDRKLRFNRPSDERLIYFRKVAVDYFRALADAFPPVKDLFDANDPGLVTPNYRHAEGGHILFRKIGLEMFTRTAIELSKAKKVSLVSAVALMKHLPTELDGEPYRNVVWSPASHTMRVSNKSVSHDVLRYMLDLNVDEAALVERYRVASGAEKDDPSIQLPKKIV